uniref:Lymphocyte antigen 6G6e-like n=1 Tax=Ailuropoda melanoleuca TaxID=9646 RepID=A0A7N5KGV8_AILME
MNPCPRSELEPLMGPLASPDLCGPPAGLTTPPPPARGRLRCYTCSFAKPCYPVPTECQDDEACGISIGTSEQNEIIERKGCLPRAQCPLQGRATYWSRSYALRHHCCEQDLCNTATTLRPLPSPLLAALLLLVASFTWGGPLLRWLHGDLQPSTQDSAPITTALETPASKICPRT